MHALPQILEPSRTTGAPFMVPVQGDGNEPDLRRGEAVIVVPVPRFYDGDGYYAFETAALFGAPLSGTAIYMVGGIGRPGHLGLWHTNHLYGTRKNPIALIRADFERAVLGKVAAHVRVFDSRLLPPMI